MEVRHSDDHQRADGHCHGTGSKLVRERSELNGYYHNRRPPAAPTRRRRSSYQLFQNAQHYIDCDSLLGCRDMAAEQRRGHRPLASRTRMEVWHRLPLCGAARRLRGDGASAGTGRRSLPGPQQSQHRHLLRGRVGRAGTTCGHPHPRAACCDATAGGTAPQGVPHSAHRGPQGPEPDALGPWDALLCKEELSVLRRCKGVR